MKPSFFSAASCGPAVLCLVLFTGCKPTTESPADHGHSHSGSNGGHSHGEEAAVEAKVAQITAHSEHYEVFAEHQPPVAGQATRFITHVTDLHSLEPRSVGGIKYVLRQGDQMFDHPYASPNKPGIYIPAITFPTAGDWRATLLVPTDGTNAAVDLGEIRVFSDSQTAQEADIGEAPEGISFLKEQQWKILTRTELVMKRRLVERLRAAATVVAKPGSIAEVIPPMAGRLVAPPEGEFPRLGERVVAGQTMALVQPAFSEATAKLGETEGDIARARLVLAQAKRDFERVRLLVESKTESQQDLELAQLSVDSAEAELAATLAIRTSYLQGTGASEGLPTVALKSPIAGVVVTARSVALGQHVGADAPIFTVLNPEMVWIEARLPEVEAPRVSSTKDAFAEAPGRPGEFIPLTGGGHGRLVFASPQVDPLLHTVAFVYEVPNPDGRFRIGEHLTVFIESVHADNAVAIPDSAIVEEGGQPVAFVQAGGETFQKRELSLGLRDGNFVQVLRGIQAGERVVTEGAFAIRLASVSTVIPAHGHVH